jgi:hypothetical protein
MNPSGSGRDSVFLGSRVFVLAGVETTGATELTGFSHCEAPVFVLT